MTIVDLDRAGYYLAFRFWSVLLNFGLFFANQNFLYPNYNQTDLTNKLKKTQNFLIQLLATFIIFFITFERKKKLILVVYGIGNRALFVF